MLKHVLYCCQSYVVLVPCLRRIQLIVWGQPWSNRHFFTKSNAVFVVCAICTCEAISCENLTARKKPSLALMRIREDVLVVIFEQFLINNILFCQSWLLLGCAIFSILVQDPVPAAEWAVEEQRLHCVSPTVPWVALLQLFWLTHGGPSLQIDREPPEPYFCRIRQVLWSQTRSNRHCCSQGSELACVATIFFCCKVTDSTASGLSEQDPSSDMQWHVDCAIYTCHEAYVKMDYSAHHGEFDYAGSATCIAENSRRGHDHWCHFW